MPQEPSSTGRTRVPSSLPGALTVVVAVLALGAGMSATAPLWTDLGNQMIGPNTPDAHHYMWWLGHTPHAILSGENPFHTYDMNWPDGVSTMNNTTLFLPAILLLPVTLLANSLVSLNILNILAIPACTAGGYWALRRLPWGRTWAGADPAAFVSDGPPAAPGEGPSPTSGAVKTPGEGTAVSAAAQGGTVTATADAPTGPAPSGLATTGHATADEPAGRLSPQAALAGATAFAISPAIVNSLVGHITMSFAPLLPVLITLSVLAWYGNRPVRTGVILGLVATAQVFTGEEVLFQAGVGALLILLVSAVSRPRAIPAAAVRLAKALASAFAVFLPIAGYPLYLQFLGPARQEGSPFTKDIFGADVTAFTTPTDRVLLHTAEQAERATKFAGGVEEHLAYLGWPLLITCLVVTVLCWRRVAVRCAAIGLVVTAVLSLGGRLWINGVWTEHRGPYRYLQEWPVTEASLATRFGLLAALFAAALLAFAVHLVLNWNPSSRTAGAPTHARTAPLPAGAGDSGSDDLGTPVSPAVRPAIGWPGAVAAAALSFVCLAPLAPVPLQVFDQGPVPEYFTTTARELPAESVVVVLPYPTATRPTAMRWQSHADYRFRMPGGYFLGPADDGHAYVGGNADPATANLLAQVADTRVPAVVTPVEQQQALADLRAWGATKIVLGPDGATPALRETVTALLGKPPVHVNGVEVWDNPLGAAG